MPGALNLAVVWTNQDTGLLLWVVTLPRVPPAYCERCTGKGRGRGARDPALGYRIGLMGTLECSFGAPAPPHGEISRGGWPMQSGGQANAACTD